MRCIGLRDGRDVVLCDVRGAVEFWCLMHVTNLMALPRRRTVRGAAGAKLRKNYSFTGFGSSSSLEINGSCMPMIAAELEYEDLSCTGMTSRPRRVKQGGSTQGRTRTSTRNDVCAILPSHCLEVLRCQSQGTSRPNLETSKTFQSASSTA